MTGILRRELASGRFAAGDRFPSQNELAARFKTNSMTAREAVAPLVHEGILERRFGSGTYVTEHRAETFVAVVSELDIAHPAVSPSFLRMIQAVRRHLEAANRRTRVYIGHALPFDIERANASTITSSEFWTDLAAGRIEGVAVVATDPWAGYQAVAGRDIPVVNTDECEGIAYLDRNELVRMGIRSLVAHGCRTVACIEHVKSPAQHGLLDVLGRELARHGLSTHPEWMVPAPIVRERGDGAAAFRALWKSREEKPDGLFVLDDMLYRDLSPMLLLNGIQVPKDLVVVSQTATEDMQPFVPEPIRLEIDNIAIGTAMARNLLNRMRDPKAPPEGLPIPIHVLEPKGNSQVELWLGK